MVTYLTLKHATISYKQGTTNHSSLDTNHRVHIPPIPTVRHMPAVLRLHSNCQTRTASYGTADRAHLPGTQWRCCPCAGPLTDSHPRTAYVYTACVLRKDGLAWRQALDMPGASYPPLGRCVTRSVAPCNSPALVSAS